MAASAVRAIERPRAFPYRLPPAPAPLRVTFIADATMFAPATLDRPAAELRPASVDLRPTATAVELRSALDRTAPHVVVAIGPPFPPAEVFGGLRALVLAHAGEDAATGWADRTLASVAGVAAWRQAPLPVADAHFAPVLRAVGPPQVVFLGRSTEHRERVLSKSKHDFDVLHVADGVFGDALAGLLRRTDVGLNAHRARGDGFEHRVGLHLAAGHLLISEPLAPAHGLEAGIDFVEVPHGDAMHRAVGAVHRWPDIGRRTRVRGRLKAEAFRASRLWPRLVADAVRDVAVFGTARHGTS